MNEIHTKTPEQIKYSEMILSMKTRLKELAVYIRENRKSYLWSERTEARHLHMLYGIARGVPMEHIESKSRTMLSEYWLKKTAETFGLEVDHDEVIRYSRSILI